MYHNAIRFHSIYHQLLNLPSYTDVNINETYVRVKSIGFVYSSVFLNKKRKQY